MSTKRRKTGPLDRFFSQPLKRNSTIPPEGPTNSSITSAQSANSSNRTINDSRYDISVIIEKKPGDGNCFFHSIAPDMNADPKSLRSSVAEYAMNPTYKASLEVLYKRVKSPADERNYNTYISCMGTDTVYVDIPFLFMTAIFLKRNIVSMRYNSYNRERGTYECTDVEEELRKLVFSNRVPDEDIERLRPLLERITMEDDRKVVYILWNGLNHYDHLRVVGKSINQENGSRTDTRSGSPPSTATLEESNSESSGVFNSQSKEVISSLIYEPHQPKKSSFPPRQNGSSKRAVQSNWFTKFPWLHYNEDNNSLGCYLCHNYCLSPHVTFDKRNEATVVTLSTGHGSTTYVTPNMSLTN